MRLALLCLLAGLSMSCQRRPSLAQGSQPYLIVSVSSPASSTKGTIAPSIDFDYEQDYSPSGGDSFFLHGAFVAKTSTGFRISWSIRQTKGNNEVINYKKEEDIPWGKLTKLRSVQGFSIDAYYSPVTADKLNP